ncbi:MAG: hypothetical protein Q7R34_07850 [Dehalococcoidia bacterium]|nr:hypothetical protein [Dehalococcoidia bacterium]
MKKVLFISLALVIALTAFMPAPALAAKPQAFSASGTVYYITPGTVKPAGDSGRFVVVERDIVGSLSGSINGAFTLSYKANVELTTQAGNLHGTMQVGANNTLNVNGKIQPLVFAGFSNDQPGNLVFMSTIDGHWNFLSGGNGSGKFDANILLIIDPLTLHVVGFETGSSINLTGQWQP